MKDDIVYYFKGELSQDQKVEFFDHLSTDPEAQKEFAGMQNAVALACFSGFENDAETAEKYLSDFRKKKRRKMVQTFFISFSKYAAVIIVAVLATYLYKVIYSKNESQSYNYLTVPAGQRAKLTLNDGTTVWLNSSSKLTYPGTFTGDTREVLLNGEAYFDVTHNEKKPFIVKTRQFNILVFGTEFNVSAYSDSPLSEVALLKGSVEVKASGSSLPYRMAENEKVSFCDNRMTTSSRIAADGKTSESDPAKKSRLEKIHAEIGKLSVSSIKNYDYFKWREGLICFDNETVEDIMRKLELYYDIRIYVEKTALLKQRYSGKFHTKDGIEQVMKVLQIENKFVYKRDLENNLITIK